jgi:hypothetical protein
VRIIFLNVQALAQILAGLEVRHDLLGHLDLVAGARVATDARVALAHREGPESAQLDAVAAHEGFGHLLEHGRDDAFDVAQIKVRIGLCEAFDQVRLGHGRRLNPGVPSPPATGLDFVAPTVPIPSDDVKFSRR